MKSSVIKSANFNDVSSKLLINQLQKKKIKKIILNVSVKQQKVAF